MRNKDKKDFDIHDVEEVISLSGCEEMAMATISIKDESNEVNACSPDNGIDAVLINSNESVPYSLKEMGQESINDTGTPFFFVGIKMEMPDDYESEASCGNLETQYSSEEYSSNHERECNGDDKCLEGMLPMKLNNASCIRIKMECEEDFDGCKLDFQTNDDMLMTIDKNNKLDSESVVRGCDVGHSSKELVKGRMDCQEDPVLRVKEEEENRHKEIAVNRMNSAFKGNLCSLDTPEELQLSKIIERQETISVECDTVFSPGKRYESKSHPSEQKRFSCDIRRSTFDEGKNLKRIHSNVGVNSFWCNVCGKSFRGKRYLKEHMRTHTAEKSFLCRVCNACFTRSSKLQSHMRTHTGEKPYSCNICQECFSEKATLKRHMQSHSGEKPFICDICKASFARKCHVEGHMLTHLRMKPYSCRICNAAFAHKQYIQEHMRTHTREKPFSCDFCKTSFSSKTTLKRHVRIHTGEKPFSCGICNASFSRKGDLKRHMRTHP